MTAILAIDAAWTLSQPSGVALLQKQDQTWRCLVVAPSYDQFLRECHGEAVNWNEVSYGSMPDVKALLDASNRLAGERVQLVTIDMPVSRLVITGRRSADQEVSRAFGAMHCGTHSPSKKRPGPLGADITEEFAKLGYLVATTTTTNAAPGYLVEVYPHPALVRLLNARERLPYKVAKSTRYWPGTTVKERIGRLLEVLNRIHNALWVPKIGAC